MLNRFGDVPINLPNHSDGANRGPSHRQFVSCVLGIISVLSVWLSQFPAAAQSPAPRQATWTTNGQVVAFACTADTVYLGGHFSYVGPGTGSGVPIDTTTG